PYSYIEFINNYLNNNNMPLPEEFKKFKDKIYDFFQQNNIEVAELSQSTVPEQNRSTAIESVELTKLTTQLESLQTDLLNKDRLIQELQSNLTESITLGESLQSKIDELSAKQSVPANLADPKININKGLNEEDTAGKQLLKELTYQDRMKLKAIQ
ncbi:MAG: hypothetical protein ACOYLE_09210, partial [Bacteroidales bacterium]